MRPDRDRDPDLVRQVRDAFNTVIFNDRFLSDEERQMALLQDLRKHLADTGAEVDRIMGRGSDLEVGRPSKEESKQ